MKKTAYDNYTAAPFVRTRLETGDLMYLVVLALLPCAGVGMYHYGLHAALLIGIAVGSAILSELFFSLIRYRSASIWDYSCVVTGLIGGLILPPSAPLWSAAALSVTAILLFKHAFGGLGRNLFNPAMAAKFVLLLLCRDFMTEYGTGQYTEAAPLVLLDAGQTPDLLSMLSGNTAGCIGTASAAAVLVTAAILLVCGLIDLTVPAAAAAAFSLCYLIAGEYGTSLYTQCVQLCGGSFLFTIFIMAEDYTTSPLSRQARIVYGVILGGAVFAGRQLGQSEEAVVFALLIANAVRPLLDRKLAPKPFGASAAKWVVREPRRSARKQRPPAQQPASMQTEADRQEPWLREQAPSAARDAFAGIVGTSAPAGEGQAEQAYGNLSEWEYLQADSNGMNTGTPGAFESVTTNTSAISPAAIHAALEEEEVSRDTDMWEVAAIIMAEMERTKAADSETDSGRR